MEHYLLLLDDKPELPLAVKQRCPKTLDDAALCTLEIESYLTVHPLHQQQTSTVSDVAHAEGISPSATVTAIHTHQGDTIIELLHTLNTRLKQLEKRVYDGDGTWNH